MNIKRQTAFYFGFSVLYDNFKQFLLCTRRAVRAQEIRAHRC